MTDETVRKSTAWALVHNYDDGSGKPLVVRIYLDADRAKADIALHNGVVFPVGEKHRAAGWDGEWSVEEALLVGEPPAPGRYSLDDITKMREAVRSLQFCRDQFRKESDERIELELRTLMANGNTAAEIVDAALAAYKAWQTAHDARQTCLKL